MHRVNWYTGNKEYRLRVECTRSLSASIFNSSQNPFTFTPRDVAQVLYLKLFRVDILFMCKHVFLTTSINMACNQTNGHACEHNTNGLCCVIGSVTVLCSWIH